MKRRHLGTGALLLCIALLLMGAAPTGAQNEGMPQQASLYERLGGLMPISVVVSDFVDVLVPDPVLNANPEIDAARERVPAAYLKYRVTSLVCQATGGPCEYRGRTMKEAHAHLNITPTEWDRMVTLFKEVLARHDVPPQETAELLAIIESTRADIVMPAQAAGASGM